MHCPNCGTKNSARAKFCVNCGEELPQLKKGRTTAAAPAPAVQQIVIKQKTNWLNAIFGILLLAILLCVGSVFLMDYTDASAANVQQMISEPQLYFDGLGRLADQFVTSARVLMANIGEGDHGGNGQGIGADGNFQANGCPAFAENTYPVCLGGDGGRCFDGAVSFIPGIDFSTREFEEAVIAYTPIFNDAATTGESFACKFDDSVLDTDGPAINCPDVPHTLDAYSVDRYVLSYKTDTCQDSFAGTGGGQLAVVGNQAGASGSSGDLCNETFYQPPTFQAVNWLPADVLNIEVFAPILSDFPNSVSTPLDQWTSEAGGISELTEALSIEINEEPGSCWVDDVKINTIAPEPNYEGEIPGLYLTCTYETTREITQLELASISLFGFGCPQPLAIDRFSIPPKELEAYEPPVEEEVACPEGYRKNLKGKCVSNDSNQEVGGSCNAGDVMDHVGNCCSPSTYDSFYDSCNPPFYKP